VILQIMLLAMLSAIVRPSAAGEGLPDETPAADLRPPAVEAGAPAPGKRVRMVVSAYGKTDVHHALYLPTDWKKGRRYPVIVEYAGNRYGTSLGTVEGSSLGYGISGGRAFIWVCMPYISKDHKRNQLTWWGDLEATVAYCKSVVADVCANYGGDREALFMAGFSRGAIACNYIGLHDDEIAALWRGFICHSHYDGVRDWSGSYSGGDRASAAVRLQRLKGRAQFISHEGSVAETRAYLQQACPQGNFTFQPLSGWGHTDTWVLHDVPERRAVRRWIKDVLESGETGR